MIVIHKIKSINQKKLLRVKLIMQVIILTILNQFVDMTKNQTILINLSNNKSNNNKNKKFLINIKIDKKSQETIKNSDHLIHRIHI